MNLASVRDMKKSVLERCGELTNGQSPFDALATKFLNEVYRGLLAGGNEFAPDCAEPWYWAKAQQPLAIDIIPNWGFTATLNAYGDRFITASADFSQFFPFYIKLQGEPNFRRVLSYDGLDLFLEGPVFKAPGDFQAAIVKLDYILQNDTVAIDPFFNKLDFKAVSGGASFVAIITPGSYSPADLATEIQAQILASSGVAGVVSFNLATRKFEFSNIYQLSFGSGVSFAESCHKALGFASDDLSAQALFEADVPTNAIGRLLSPMEQFQNRNEFLTAAEDVGKIFNVDNNTMIRKFPINQISYDMPSRFSLSSIRQNGTTVVHFNSVPSAQKSYPSSNLDEYYRVIAEYIPKYPDLIDNENDEPLVPLEFRSYLVYGASHMLMIRKSDPRAKDLFDLAKNKLSALVNDNRKGAVLTGNNYARLIPRREGFFSKYLRFRY